MCVHSVRCANGELTVSETAREWSTYYTLGILRPYRTEEVSFHAGGLFSSISNPLARVSPDRSLSFTSGCGRPGQIDCTAIRWACSMASKDQLWAGPAVGRKAGPVPLAPFVSHSDRSSFQSSIPPFLAIGAGRRCENVTVKRKLPIQSGRGRGVVGWLPRSCTLPSPSLSTSPSP